MPSEAPKSFGSGYFDPFLRVFQCEQMGNTLTIRLPKELLDRLRLVSRRAGLPVGRVVRRSLETTLADEDKNPLLQFAGVIKGGPRNLSSRKGFSRE
jgi:predicted DNA-binding protein